MKFSAISLTAALAMAQKVSAAVPAIDLEVENPTTGHRYGRIDGPFTWVEAEAMAATLPERCDGRKAHLLTIEDQEENDYVTNNVLAASSWMGFSDSATEGEWQWTTGELSFFLNWDEGLPDSKHGDEDGGIIKTNGKWNDNLKNDQGTKKAAVVEWDCVKSTTLGPEVEFGGHIYSKLARKMSYKDGLGIMEQLPEKCGVKPHMVTIGSAEENSQVMSIAGDNVWIGYDDTKTEGEFTWVTGEKNDYKNWAPGEPNDFSGFELKGEDATHIYVSGNYAVGQWNDLPTTGTDYIVVAEWDCEGESPTSQNPLTGGSSGDPHVKLWNGTSFDFHGGCDLVLVTAPHFSNGLGLDIHIRTKIKTWWSFIDKAVLRIGQDTLQVQGGQNTATYWVNGVEGSLEEGQKELEETIAGLKIHYKDVSKKQKRFHIDVARGVRINLETFLDFVRVTVKVDDPTNSLFAGAKGLMGLFPSGHMLGRKGEVIENTDVFAQDWQVHYNETKLFDNLEGAQHPEACQMPEAGSMTKRRRLGEALISSEDAAIACSRVSEHDRDACIYDVLATNDKDMAGAY